MTREELITEIKGYVKQNGNGEIQGEGLQNILVLMSNFFNSIEEFEEYKESISTSWAEFVQSNNNALENKANKQHTHNISDVVGLEEFLMQVVQGLDDELKKTATKVELEAVKMELENTSKALESISQTGAKGEIKGAGVLTLPKNTLSSVGSLKIRGLTVTNIVNNGGFTNGANGWADVSLVGLKLENGIMSFRAIKKDGRYYCYISNYNVLDIIYRCANIKCNSNKVGLGIAQDAKVYHSGSGNFERLSYIEAVKSDNNYWNQFSVTDKRESDWDTIELKECYSINLTQTFGAGNEPTKEWCDEHLPNFFDGTKSVSAMKRVKSIGHNLVNVEELIKNRSVMFATGSIAVSENSFCTPLIRIPNKILYHNVIFGSSSVGYALYDIDGKYIRGASQMGSINNTDGKAYYCRLTIPKLGNTPNWNYTNLEDIFLSVVNKYSKYESFKKFISSDNLLMSAGAYSDYSSNDTIVDNIGFGKITKDWFSTYRKNKDSDKNELITFISSDLLGWKYSKMGMVSIEGLNEGVNIGQFYVANNNGQIYFFFNLDVTRDVAEKELIGKNVLFYKNNAPTSIPVKHIGSIVNKANGTIFVEDVANSIGLYDGGIEPIYNLPILKIDVISKIGDDGIAIELDATKATITNRVVRHPDLKDGDIVYIEYYHDLNPIYGDNTLTYYNSYKVKQNPADSKYYELSLDFNEQGEVILKKTEV